MRSFTRSFLWLLLIYFLLAPSWILAQQKKPLDHTVYDFWNRITEQKISAHGDWVMFVLGPEEKDEELRLKRLEDGQSFTFSRGDSANFSDDSKFAVFKIKVPKDSLKQARRDKKKPDQMPKDSLGIFDLKAGELVKIDRVKSYKMPKESGGWLAYHLEKSVTKNDSLETKQKAEASEKQKDEKKVNKGKKKTRAQGTDLVLRSLKAGTESRYENVTGYEFSENGKWLVYATASEDSSADGIYAVEVETRKVTTILVGKGDYKKTALDEQGKQVAFLSNRDDISAGQPSFTLYYWRIGSPAPEAVATEGTSGVPPGWWVSEYSDVSFSQNGKRVLFGTAPRPEPEPEIEENDDEKVRLDVWNWKDPYLQPMQLKNVKQERNRSYAAIAHLDRGQVVQLGTLGIQDVEVGNEGNADMALGTSNNKYRQLVSWDSPRYSDVYLIDVATGRSKLVVEKLQARARLSPGAKYLTWWNRDELAWYALNCNEGGPVSLTGRIPYPVHNEKHDWAYKPNPYGNAGWTEKDQLFLVYDKHDVWATDPSGKHAPRNLTDGMGRANNVRFRYLSLDPEERFLDPDSPTLLSAFHLRSKQAGFYRDHVEGNRQPAELLMMDRFFSRPQKAKNADELLFTRQSFAEFPDAWVSDADFNDMQKVSNANPQQSDYLWGTAELIDWTSLDGIPLQGILYKPDDFDPGKKYPMIVYFYEKMSDRLHRHAAPAPSRSIVNFSFYVSRGYLLFVPDVPYKVGYPGESALHAVVPGVTHLIKQGFVDADHIGVQGHSWGGYQIAYMVTQTNIFKAAEAGAPVSNMISAYGGIRWGTGLSRMFQYERTQSRIGGSLWEYPMRYVENSPIFWADRIETPLLMMHNDEDGAVPWYQGIELFVAMRRLGKKAWLLNYNDEAHGLRKYHNKVDWAKRMQQFFDHYLKGEPAPVWLEIGVPAVDKGKTLGFESVETTTNGTR